MYNNNLNTFMQSMLESQRRFFEAAAEQRDQFSETMSSVVHNQLDASIERLQRFHDLVSDDTSGMKSDVLAATIKNAIDHHYHIKDRFATHTHHANSYKRTLRRLAMGAMAAFGVMSGVKAADAFDPGKGDGGANSSTSTSQKATVGKSSLESRSHGSVRDLKAMFEAGSSAQSQATTHATPPNATTPTKPVKVSLQASSMKQDEQGTPPNATTPTKPVKVSLQASSMKQDEQGTPPNAKALPNAVEAMPKPLEPAPINDTEYLEIADALLSSPVQDSPAQGLKILKDLVQSENATPATLVGAAIKIMLFHRNFATLTEQKSALEMASRLTDRIKAHPSADRNDIKKAENAAGAIDRLISNLSSTPVEQGIPDVSMVAPEVQHASYEDAMKAAIELINLGPQHFEKAFELLIKSANEYGGKAEHKIRAAEEIFKLHEKYTADGKKNELMLETATALLEAANKQLGRDVLNKSTKPEEVLRTLELLRQFESPVFSKKLGHIDIRDTEYLAYVALSNFKNPEYNRLAAEGLMKLGAGNHIVAVEYYLKSVAPDRNPTSNDIKLAAEAVQKFGAEYKDAQANLWLSYVLHKDTLPKDIMSTANMLDRLGEAYQDKAATILVALASKPNAEARHIMYAAKYLMAYGKNYHEKAAALCVKAANTPNVEIYYSLNAADMLIDIGVPYHEMAAEFLEKAANHRQATPSTILENGKKLEGLGEAYHDRAEGLYKKVVSHKDAHKEHIRMATDALNRLGKK